VPATAANGLESRVSLDNKLVKEAMQKGVDLREYAAEVDAELFAVEKASLQDFSRETAKAVRLSDGIHDCDNILARMQETLLGFQVLLPRVTGIFPSPSLCTPPPPPPPPPPLG
jgi:hypothetical protein